jgi:hypothetical protein
MWSTVSEASSVDVNMFDKGGNCREIQILFSFEKYLFHSSDSLAEILQVTAKAVLNHLRDTLGMKHFHLRCIP